MNPQSIFLMLVFIHYFGYLLVRGIAPGVGLCFVHTWPHNYIKPVGVQAFLPHGLDPQRIYRLFCWSLYPFSEERGGLTSPSGLPKI